MPSEVTAKFDLALVKRLDAKELTRAFRVVIDGFIGEVRSADDTRADKLEGTTALLKQSLDYVRKKGSFVELREHRKFSVPLPPVAFKLAACLNYNEKTL